MAVSGNNKPRFESLVDDINHPNPNINNQAFILMRMHWPRKSLDYFIGNLDSDNNELRRKSVKALSVYEEDIVLPMLHICLASEKEIVKVSCLKVLVKVAANINLDSFYAKIIEVIDLVILIESVQVTLTVISLLRQLGEIALPKLIQLSRNQDILMSKAAITALGEIDDDRSKKALQELSIDYSIDNLLRESALQAISIKKI